MPDPLLVSVEEYLATSYPDGDREYLDGVVVERNLGSDEHSALQAILTGHLLGYAKQLQLAIRPECRTRITASRYRVPDIVVMMRPYQKGRALVDAPFLIIEILSPDDRVKDTIRRFQDYASVGVLHILLMDPEARETFIFSSGDLARRDLPGFDVPGRGFLPFDSRELLARLDEE
jgi:Uma2 family endonuclease